MQIMQSIVDAQLIHSFILINSFYTGRPYLEDLEKSGKLWFGCKRAG